MEQSGKKRGFVKCSALFEVDLKKSDGYKVTVQKICEAVGLTAECDVAVLLSANGSVISHDQNGEDEGTWTLSSYLSKQHIAPEKLQLGVGILSDSVRKM